MTALNTSITADGTGRLITTGIAVAKAFVFVTSASSIGGGTLTLGIRKLGSTDTLITIDTLLAGDQGEYPIGGEVELHYTLTGATSPTIEILASQGR